MQGIIIEEFGILRIKQIMMTVIVLQKNIMNNENSLHNELEIG